MNGMAHVLSAPAAGTAADRLAGLFDRHHSRLYRLARRLAPSAEDAEDLVQETFLRATRAAVPPGPTDEEAWLVRVLVNIRRDQWRRAALRARYVRTAVLPSAADGAEGAVVARATVWRALDALTPRRRAVLVMHDLEDLPIREIASVLGIAGATARWHLSKGRKQLARVLGVRSGGVDEDR